MNKWYILKDKIPIESSILDYISWLQENEDQKIVEQTEIGTVRVSTVFLGLDHRFWSNDGLPVLFETMIFGGKEDQYQNRYCTWDEAVTGHKLACDMVLASLIDVNELRDVVIKHLN